MGVRLSFVSGLIGGGHYLRQYRGGTRQIVPKAALSAALSGRNAADSSQGGIIGADSSQGGIIGSIIVAERGR